MQDLFLKLLSLAAIILLIVSFIYIFIEIFKINNPVKNLISKYQLMVLLSISTIATIGSLSLSLYFKLAPCELCWYQRVFLFVVPIMSWIAVYKKDLGIRLYIFILSIFGSVFALYHSLIQSSIFKGDSVFCNPMASAADCAVPAFTYFGFVTVPVISLATFVLLMIVSYPYKK
jgi:disulfide bond formation protein DsbB